MASTGCQCSHVIITEGGSKSGILTTVQDANTGWAEKYLCDPNMAGLTQNMKQNVSSIVIDMGISHDRHYQQVETATMAGTYGVPVAESHKVAKYWATQFHKASLKITGSESGRSIMKRLQEKRVELVKCEVFSPPSS
jgi:hypothetical protein